MIAFIESVDTMITILAQAVSHLQNAVIIRLAKLLETNNFLNDDDNWPPDFDPNDIPVYFSILADLMRSEDDTDTEYLFTGKFLRLLVILIPEYVDKYMRNLSYEAYLALSAMCSSAGGGEALVLPAWRDGSLV